MKASETTLITLSDLATLLAVNPDRLIAMRAGGLLPLRALRVGPGLRGIRFHLDETAEWIAAGMPPARQWKSPFASRIE